MDNFKIIDFAELSNKLKDDGCLIDSSSIIYLDKVEILPILVNNYKIKTIDTVIEEVTSNLDKQLNEIKSLIKIEIIKKVSELNLSKFSSQNFLNLNQKLLCKTSKIDKELIYTSIYYNYPILTDDGAISKICYHIDYQYYNSLIAILLSFNDDLLTKNKTIEAFFSLNKFGRYNTNIYNFSFNLLEKILKSKKI